jgi:protein-L-isoaspartate(D-aspartate) O-methyltransferase
MSHHDHGDHDHGDDDHGDRDPDRDPGERDREQLAHQRHRMVDRDLRARGIVDERVLEAMDSVPRECFVPGHLRDVAYDDHALPIAAGQTISQPYIVALMSEALELSPEDRVLEIGAGSGYAAAVLGRLCRRVVTVERHHELAVEAQRALAEVHAGNVVVVEGDGTMGHPAEAPYDAISVTAAAPQLVDALLVQLADGGRLVAPVGDADNQELVRVRRIGDRFERRDLGGVRFVPLVGEGGRPAAT